MTRLLLVASLIAALAIGSTGSGLAADRIDYPYDTLHIVVPTGAGGGVDTLTRGVARFLPRYLDVDIVVENHGGAAARVGSTYFERVARANPGQYIVTTIQPMAGLSQVEYGEYDISSWTPLFFLTSDNYILMVREDSDFGNFDDLLAAFEQRRVLKGTDGPRGIGNIQSLVLEQELAVEAEGIPYPGTAAFVAAMMTGDVDYVLGPIQNYFIFPDVRGLLVFGDQRDPRVPHIPTHRELGYEAPILATTRGFHGGPDMPDELAAKLERALLKVAEDPEFLNWLDDVGLPGVLEGRESYAAYTQYIMQTVDDLWELIAD